ncbi:hypothetical protein TI04_01955 [Achromatium sp. WMS2]|nr:hypothetical protein TI04_01955 [Achromatium sp. WMS2]
MQSIDVWPHYYRLLFALIISWVSTAAVGINSVDDFQAINRKNQVTTENHPPKCAQSCATKTPSHVEPSKKPEQVINRTQAPSAVHTKPSPLAPTTPKPPVVPKVSSCPQLDDFFNAISQLKIYGTLEYNDFDIYVYIKTTESNFSTEIQRRMGTDILSLAQLAESHQQLPSDTMATTEQCKILLNIAQQLFVIYEAQKISCGPIKIAISNMDLFEIAKMKDADYHELTESIIKNCPLSYHGFIAQLKDIRKYCPRIGQRCNSINIDCSTLTGNKSKNCQATASAVRGIQREIPHNNMCAQQDIYNLVVSLSSGNFPTKISSQVYLKCGALISEISNVAEQLTALYKKHIQRQAKIHNVRGCETYAITAQRLQNERSLKWYQTCLQQHALPEPSLVPSTSNEPYQSTLNTNKQPQHHLSRTK